MTQTVLKKSRIEWLDVLRGIGVVLMVMGHIYFGERFSVYIHAFHMPLFFFVSGFFFNPKKNYSEFIIHDLKTLILPFSICFLICQFLQCVLKGDFDIRYAFVSYFCSNHFLIVLAGGFWFLPCLFICKQLYYWARRLTRGKLFPAVVVAGTLTGNYLPFKLPLCLDSALSCLALLWIGEILKSRQENRFVKWLLDLPAPLLCLLFLVNGALIFKNGLVNVRTNDYGNAPLYWLNCLMASLFWANASKRLAGLKLRPIKVVVRELQYAGRESIAYLTMNEACIFIVSSLVALVGIPTDPVLSKALCLVAVLGLIKGLRILIAKAKMDFVFGRVGK